MRCPRAIEAVNALQCRLHAVRPCILQRSLRVTISGHKRDYSSMLDVVSEQCTSAQGKGVAACKLAVHHGACSIGLK